MQKRECSSGDRRPLFVRRAGFYPKTGLRFTPNEQRATIPAGATPLDAGAQVVKVKFSPSSGPFPHADEMVLRTAMN